MRQYLVMVSTPLDDCPVRVFADYAVAKWYAEGLSEDAAFEAVSAHIWRRDCGGVSVVRIVEFNGFGIPCNDEIIHDFT